MACPDCIFLAPRCSSNPPPPPPPCLLPIPPPPFFGRECTNRREDGGVPPPDHGADTPARRRPRDSRRAERPGEVARGDAGAHPLPDEGTCRAVRVDDDRDGQVHRPPRRPHRRGGEERHVSGEESFNDDTEARTGRGISTVSTLP